MKTKKILDSFLKDLKEKMDKRENESLIFNYLDKACVRGTQPFSRVLTDHIAIQSDILGFMGCIINGAFYEMRKTNRNSLWVIDALALLWRTKDEPRRVCTVNVLRKYLLECQSCGFIEWAKECQEQILVKENIGYLFGDLIDG